MRTSTLAIVVLAISSGVYYHQEKTTEIAALKQEVETMQHDQVETTVYISRLTGLLRHHHIKYGDSK